MSASALDFARRRHDGQTRIGGEPHINHPIAVSKILWDKGFTNPVYQITGYFHDLKEDTDATDEEILFYGGGRYFKCVK